MHHHQFANYLLPFNVAIGVNGGIDLITNTFRIGVEKYITNKEEEDGGLPTRALVSLDIVNCSTQCLDKNFANLLLATFRALAPLADMLYKEYMVRYLQSLQG